MLSRIYKLTSKTSFSKTCSLLRRFSTSTTLNPSTPVFTLKRPYQFNEEDYSMMNDQVEFVNCTEDILKLVNDHRYDLNEIHLTMILQRMFHQYIHFSEGNSIAVYFEIWEFMFWISVGIILGRNWTHFFNLIEISQVIKPLLLDIINLCKHNNSFGFGMILLNLGILSFLTYN